MNAIVKIQSNIASLEPKFNQILKESGISSVSFAKESLFAKQALEKNDFLLQTAQRNQKSLMNAILNISTIGLSLNPAEKKAYLVPRDGEVCLDVSYMGLKDLACESGAVKWVSAKLVYQKDKYESRGIGELPIHTYDPFEEDRGEVKGVYCVAALTDGKFLVEEMSRKECLEIRDRTKIWQKSKSGPWRDFEGEMIKKTVIKRASKLWPKSSNSLLDKAIHISNETDGLALEYNREEEKKRIEERQETERIDYIKKDELIEKIKELSAKLTKGQNPTEKARFVVNELKVPTFDHLKKQSIEMLEGLVVTLDAKTKEHDKPKTVKDVYFRVD